MRKGYRPIISVVVLVMLSSLLLAGCWDRVEVNDRALVLAFAIDKEEDDRYRMTIQVPLVSSLGGPSGGGGGTSGDKSYYVDSATGRTLREASSVLQARMSRQLFYAHHRVIVIGEETARSGLRTILDIIARFPENRLTAYIVMAQGKGAELLQAQPQLERFSAEAMRELINMQGVAIKVKDLAQMLNTPGIDAHLPVMAAVESHPKGKTKEIQVIGSAVFVNDRPVHRIKREQANPLRWFQPAFQAFSITLPIEKNKNVSLDIHHGSADILPIPKKDHMHYRINLQAKGTIIEDHSGINWGDPGNIRMLETMLGRKLSKGVREMLSEVVNRQGSDPVGLGLALARKRPNLWKEQYRDRWNEHLKDVTFEINTRVLIPSNGQTTENLTEEEKR